MLRVNTSDKIRKEYLVNFASSVGENPEQYKIEFWDLFTGKTVVIEASYPEISKLDAEGAIFLMDELRYHLHQVLAKEKPDAQHLQDGFVWKQRCRQLEVLIALVRGRLEDLLWEVFQQNWPGEGGDMMELYPCICLPTADDQILYWYTYDCFAHHMDEEMIPQVRLRLEYKMIDWLDELDEMIEENPDVEFTAYYQLQKFRCDEKQRQIEQLDRMVTARSAGGRNQKQEASCHPLPIGVVWDQVPQWLGMPELIEEIEKVKLCMKQAETFPDNQVAKLETKHNELLDELNRRMVAIVCSCIGCDEPEQAVLEHAQQLGDIPYPVCFLEGGALKQPEDVIHCWYLNERFPFKMHLEQLKCVESVLKQQLAALEDAYDVYNNDGERSLWELSCELKERQLDQIREEIYAAEATLGDTGIRTMI